MNALESTVHDLAQSLLARSWRLAAAESCTGGLVCAACTSVPGSSDWFERGFVTYSNEAKTQMLGVPAELILRHGAVSAEVARAMALGARQRSLAQVALSVTGIAGPGGATPGKPVGFVCFAWSVGERLWSGHATFSGNRQYIREAAAQYALQHLLLALGTCS